MKYCQNCGASIQLDHTVNKINNSIDQEKGVYNQQYPASNTKNTRNTQTNHPHDYSNGRLQEIT